MEIMAKGFMLGMATGPACMATCFPVLLPVVIGGVEGGGSLTPIFKQVCAGLWSLAAIFLLWFVVSLHIHVLMGICLSVTAAMTWRGITRDVTATMRNIALSVTGYAQFAHAFAQRVRVDVKQRTGAFGAVHAAVALHQRVPDCFGHGLIQAYGTVLA